MRRRKAHSGPEEEEAGKKEYHLHSKLRNKALLFLGDVVKRQRVAWDPLAQLRADVLYKISSALRHIMKRPTERASTGLWIFPA